MPYKSEKQRRFMHVKHPGIARRWDKETGGKVEKREQLTPDQIKNRKRIQSGVAQATGGLGLGALGAFGASKLGGAGRTALKAQKAMPVLRKINTKKAENLSLGLSTAGAGIGGAGSFNFARYTKAEADKGKRVKKNMDSEIGDFPIGGEVGRRLTPDEIAGKETVRKDFDSERSRGRRADNYQTATQVTTGALGASAGFTGHKARKEGFLKPVGNKSQKAFSLKGGKKAAIAGGMALGAAGTAEASRRIPNKKKGSWSPYK